MFKENKEFWLYVCGSIVMLIGIFIFLGDRIGGVGVLDDFRYVPPSRSKTPVVSRTPTPNLDITESINPTIDVEKDYQARIITNRGVFTIDLFERAAPNTVNNFVYLSLQGYYNGTSFYRLIPGVLIQGGSDTTKNDDPDDDSFGNPGYVIDEEINWDALDLPEHVRQVLREDGYSSTPRLASEDIEKYSLAMASVGPGTSGSQFFIVLGEKSDQQIAALQGRHTVFAKVIDNFELIDELNLIKVEDQLSNSPRPTEDFVIESIEVFFQN